MSDNVISFRRIKEVEYIPVLDRAMSEISSNQYMLGSPLNMSSISIQDDTGICDCGSTHRDLDIHTTVREALYPGKDFSHTAFLNIYASATDADIEDYHTNPPIQEIIDSIDVYVSSFPVNNHHGDIVKAIVFSLLDNENIRVEGVAISTTWDMVLHEYISTTKQVITHTVHFDYLPTILDAYTSLTMSKTHTG